MSRLRRVAALALLLATLAPGVAAAPASKRVAFIIDSWHQNSHPDVIGRRFLEGYKVADRSYTSPVTVASVFTDDPRPTDQTRALAAKHHFRIAGSIAEALLEDPRAPRPRLAVDGILVATRENPQRNGMASSPTPRLQTMREIYRILDQAGATVPIFIDKMLSANWADSQTIVAEAARRQIPLMAGSVLPHTPLDRPVRAGRVEVAVAITAGPYWAWAHHTAEFLQGFMEQRAAREAGITSIREAGASFGTLPDRDRWGGRLFDALLPTARTRATGGGRAESSILLIQYADGARAVLALLPRAFEEGELLLGAQYVDGSTAMGGLVLKGEPFDHFGYLVHALVEFYTTGKAPVPVERALLTTGVVLLGQQAREGGGVLATPSLAVQYLSPRRP